MQPPLAARQTHDEEGRQSNAANRSKTVSFFLPLFVGEFLFLICVLSADPLGSFRRVDVLCSPFGETRVGETADVGGPHALGPPRAT